MVNYSNGKIYKIEPLNGEEGDIFIGSTTKEYLSQRMNLHRKDYKRFKNGELYLTTSYNLFEKYGVDNCKIILLESVSSNSKDVLLSRKAHYIKILKCVNKIIPLRTSKEYREENKEKLKEYKKEYCETNKEKLKEYRTEYREINKEKLQEYKKEYCEANKDKIKEYKREYRKANRDKINEQKREQRKFKKLNIS